MKRKDQDHDSNPLGRLDILAGRLLETAIEKTGNPIYRAVYQENKPIVDVLLNKWLGPESLRRLAKKAVGGRPPRSGRRKLPAQQPWQPARRRGNSRGGGGRA